MSQIGPPIYLAHAGLLLSNLIAGFSFPIVTLLSPGLPLNLVTALRFLVALLALLPFLPRQKQALTPSLPALGLYWLMGICLAGFFGSMFWVAPRLGSVSMASLYVCVPLFTFLLSVLLRVERASLQLLGILLVGGLGALNLARVGAGSSEFRFGTDEQVYLLGCGAVALYPVLSKWGLQRGWLVKNATVRSAWGLLTGGLSLGLLSLILESPEEIFLLSISDVLILIYLGVISSSLTFWLSQRAMLVLNPSEVVAYTYVIPLVSLFLLFIEDPLRIGWSSLPGVFLVLFCTASLLNRRTVEKLIFVGNRKRRDYPIFLPKLRGAKK